MKRIILKDKEERRILLGHPWVYDNEVERIVDGKGGETTLEKGEWADVESSPLRGRSRYLGRAIVNPASHIIARLYSPSKEGLDKGFFKRRIREALEGRIAAGYDLSRESARIVFGEADRLPGLVVDRFVGLPADAAEAPDPAGGGGRASWLVIQFLAYGMDSRREMILEALEEVLSSPLHKKDPPSSCHGKEALGVPLGIIENFAPVRELEGLPGKPAPQGPELPLSADAKVEGAQPDTAGSSVLIKGSFPKGGIIIRENGLLFFVDPMGGQKTGYFLDQKDNRRRTAEYAARLAEQSLKGHGLSSVPEPFRILDCFCYTGGFALQAAKAALSVCAQSSDNSGAGSAGFPVRVSAVDVSPAALELVRKNAELNGLTELVQTVEADVFDFLRAEERRRERYDLVILDPPAFAKNRAVLENAMRGYREINLRALKLLSRGGILVSCSCSHAVDEGRFKRMITAAAADAEKRIVQMDFCCQSPDHPILAGYDESLYLKCGFYRVVG